MNTQPESAPTSWVDPDDAPELADNFFEQGDWKIGEKSVSAEAGAVALNKTISLGNHKAQHVKHA